MDMLNPAVVSTFHDMMEAERKYTAARKVLSLLNTLNNTYIKKGNTKGSEAIQALIKRHFKYWFNQLMGNYKTTKKIHDELLSSLA